MGTPNEGKEIIAKGVLNSFFDVGCTSTMHSTQTTASRLIMNTNSGERPRRRNQLGITPLFLASAKSQGDNLDDGTSFKKDLKIESVFLLSDLILL